MPTRSRIPRPFAAAFLAAALALAACAAAQPSGAEGGLSPTVAADSTGEYERLERDVLAELNSARTDPRGYAARLDSMVVWFDGKLMRRPGASVVFETNEGAPAVAEAITVLRRLQPLPPFTPSAGLARAARDHVRDQGPGGRTGHTGSDGSSASDRVSRYGEWDEALSENIAYGPLDARGMIVGLIVDDGVPSRGHRLNIFDPRVRRAGVACGPHRTYGRMCVIVHAGAYVEREGAARGSRR